MQLLTITGFYGPALVRALGTTLMHSLWQGALLAFAGGLIIVFTRKSTAALRYNLLTGAMMLFTLGVIGTFLSQIEYTHTAEPVKAGTVKINPAVVYQIQNTVGAKNTETPSVFKDIVVGYLNAHMDTIVLIWFLIICAKSVKMAAGIYEIYQLKHVKVTPAGVYWQDRLAKLSSQLNISKAVRLLESGLVKVPMIVGHMKPLILIPVGFINALSVDQVDAILVHELAHIKRRDYLTNLVQSFLEIIFFFNPGILWISQLIKAERENCCDDIALGTANSKAGYIQALLSCQEYQQTSGVSIAFAGQKSSLLNRVRRMVNNRNQSLNVMEKTLLTICMVAAGLCTVAFSAKKETKTMTQQKMVHPMLTVKPAVKTTKDVSVKATTAVISTHQDVTIANTSKAPEAKTDTVKPATYLYNSRDFNDGTTMMVSVNKDGKKETAYLFKRSGILYQIFMQKREPVSIYIDGQQKPIDEYKTRIEELLQEYREVSELPPPPPAQPAEPPVPGRGVPRPPAPNTFVAKPQIRPVPPLPPVAPVKPDSTYDVVTKSLIRKGVIKDEGNFDISISNESLVVDGVTQPEELHQEILKKLEMKKGDKISWHCSSHN
ncbi:MAG TPA: M56 family metallopeptidase [Mucilaginibacter sp.]|nr:M56 family metallopeptidase [Mucilaginibacter sp.]